VGKRSEKEVKCNEKKHLQITGMKEKRKEERRGEGGGVGRVGGGRGGRRMGEWVKQESMMDRTGRCKRTTRAGERTQESHLATEADCQWAP
jgi:hypothetical protein